MASVVFDANELDEVIERAISRTLSRIDFRKQRDAAGRVLLNKMEAAEMMSISVSTLDRLSAPRGDLRCVRPFGPKGRVLYSPEAIREWIAARERETTGGLD